MLLYTRYLCVYEGKEISLDGTSAVHTAIKHWTKNSELF